jgi:hypothetical protein
MKTTPLKNKLIHFMLTNDLNSKLQKICEATNESVTNILRRLIRNEYTKTISNDGSEIVETSQLIRDQNQFSTKNTSKRATVAVSADGLTSPPGEAWPEVLIRHRPARTLLRFRPPAADPAGRLRLGQDIDCRHGRTA